MSVYRMLTRGAMIVAAFPLMGRAQAACKWKSSDPWVRRQAEFYDDSKGTWSNDSLRKALIAAAKLPRPWTLPVTFGVHVESREGPLGPNADSAIALLRTLAATRGSTWPTKSVVGAAGAHAAAILSQRDTALSRVGLHRFMEAGPAESPAMDVAMWEDRLRVQDGRKQIYGTQFRINEQGKAILLPMEDSTHADLRREDAGLPPFKVSLCVASKAK